MSQDSSAADLQRRLDGIDGGTPEVADVGPDDKSAVDCSGCSDYVRPGERFVRVMEAVSDGEPSQYASYEKKRMVTLCMSCVDEHDLLSLLDEIEPRIATDGGTEEIPTAERKTCPQCGHEFPPHVPGVDHVEEPRWSYRNGDERVVLCSTTCLRDFLAGIDETDPRGDVRVDGGVDGAIDNDWDDAERSTQDQLDDNLAQELAEARRRPSEGDVCIDLVTRQVVYVVEDYSLDVAEYYVEHDVDLRSYKANAYLPVDHDDDVFGVVYVERSGEGIHKPGKIYPTPRGRLDRVPVENAESLRGDA